MKKCKVCGKPITAPRMRRYCSFECYRFQNNHDKKTRRQTRQAEIEKLISKYSSVKERHLLWLAHINRPYTKETAYLIRLYYSQGDSLEKICLALERSPENVLPALEGIIPDEERSVTIKWKETNI